MRGETWQTGPLASDLAQHVCKKGKLKLELESTLAGCPMLTQAGHYSGTPTKMMPLQWPTKIGSEVIILPEAGRGSFLRTCLPPALPTAQTTHHRRLGSLL